ncbi:MAG: SRPBCC family protein [Bacteroidia bacterium]|nr:SRPBCC family protein [Bacteroidia bacterium]
MTTIESNETTVNKNADEVYTFLSDFRNFEKLMPEQVTNWKATEDECSFTIKGMASLGMKIKQKTPNSLIEIERSGKAPFDFTMKCVIVPYDSQSGVRLVLEADLNPMLKMLAEKPLTNFLNLLVTRLAEISSHNS